MVIGVTGGYCAGKDVAAEILGRYGIVEINEDKIGHQALEVLKPEITETFGRRILAGNGAIDRKALGSIVFAQLDELRRLERIVHPWMVEETRRKIAAAGRSHAMINAAILHRMGLHLLCDHILVIHAPYLIRFLRARNRDRLGLKETLKRVRIQREQRQIAGIPKQFLSDKGASVDTVRVKNGGTKLALAKRLEELLSELGIIGR